MSEKHLGLSTSNVAESSGSGSSATESGSAGESLTEVSVTHGSTTEGGNAVVSRTVDAPPEVVWSVLADGWMYATWVVGASRIREVDPAWPAPGSRIHHSVGLWPALLDDNTEVLNSVADGPIRELLLQARAWPAGEAQVRLSVASAGANRSSVSIVEDVTTGPGSLLPRTVRQALIVPRNRETLQRLALIAQGRYRESVQDATEGTTGELRAR